MTMLGTSHINAQAARAAAVAAAVEVSEDAPGSENVIMDKVAQPERRKTEDPLDDGLTIAQTIGGLAERLAGACTAAAATIAAQGLHGTKRGT